MKNNRYAPQQIMITIAAAGLILCVGLTWLALSLPVYEASIKLVDGQVRLQGESQFVLAFEMADGQSVAAYPELFIEEPDMLSSYADINRFFEQQGILASAYASGHLLAVMDDGKLVPLHPRPRQLQDLPVAFWMQLVFAWLGLVLASAVWAFQQHSLSTALFALTGLGYAMSAAAASVYSTRELGMPYDWFRGLSIINHAGGMLFACALTPLLWNYPQRLTRLPLSRPFLSLGMVIFLLDTLQWLPAPSYWYAGLLGIFFFSFPGAWLQWRRSAGHPVERAALRWFLLSVYMGAGLYAALMLLPLALEVQPFASQSLMLGVFLLIYGGIAMSVTRYRLFDLDRWWFTAWLWFLGGLAVILLDLLLLTLLPMSNLVATSLALAIIGWLYFPMRQWLWNKLGRSWADMQKQLPVLSRHLVNARSTDDLRQAWREMLREAFNPLHIETLDHSLQTVQFDNDGLNMRVPDLSDLSALVVCMPAQGTRLFSRQDAEFAATLFLMVGQAHKALQGRARGVAEERDRVMRDLHDDLGGKLMALSYKTRGTEAEPIARDAMQDMRDLIQALGEASCRLSEACDQWRWELQSRAESMGLELELTLSDAQDDPLLQPRERSNLSRVLREALTNAARHSRTQRVDVTVDVESGRVRFVVENSGVPDVPVENWVSGRGTESIRKRIAELDGVVTWQVDEQEAVTRVVIEVPCRVPVAGAVP